MRNRLRWCLFILALGVLLAGCSRDPNVRKQKYYESGIRYFAEQKYREATIQLLNALALVIRGALILFEQSLFLLDLFVQPTSYHDKQELPYLMQE